MMKLKKIKRKTHWEEKNISLQSRFIEFKNQLTSKFEKKFLYYTDVVSSRPKHSEFLTYNYSKLYVITEKINAEKEKKS